jgi:hypothetical protein
VPLDYRDKGTSGTQIAVTCGRLLVAHIRKNTLSAMTGHAVRWDWFFAIGDGPRASSRTALATRSRKPRPVSNETGRCGSKLPGSPIHPDSI